MSDDDHGIRATRTEKATWRFEYTPWAGKELDEPEVRLEPHSEKGRGVDPWENIRCECGTSFDSINEAAKHMDRYQNTDGSDGDQKEGGEGW